MDTGNVQISKKSILNAILKYACDKMEILIC